MFRFIVVSVLFAVALAASIESETPKVLPYFIKSALNKPRTSGRNVELVNGTFTSRIDHFRPQDGRTIEMVYHANLNFWDGNGPLFFFIQDDLQPGTRWIEEGLMVDLASELNGALFQAEHRYFGQNLPTPDASFENLQYFTVENTIADIAVFITRIKEEHNAQDSHVVLWGSNIGAKLAVWTRQKYPHLVRATFSSSGLFRPDPVTTSFYNTLDWNLYSNDRQCHENVRAAFTEINRRIEAGEQDSLQNDLDLCHPVDINNPSDIALFYESLIQFITDFIDENHIQGLQSFCRSMNVFPDDPFRSYARWVDFVYNGDDECFNFNYDESVEFLRSEDFDSPALLSGRRQFLYGRCTQLGYMKITSEEEGLFPNVITSDYQYGLCEDVFGEGYDRSTLELATRDLLIQYGTREEQVRQVIYTNGELDSWLDHGITDDDIAGSIVINLQYSAKSHDLDSIAGWQSAELVMAKLEIFLFIREWVLEN